MSYFLPRNARSGTLLEWAVPRSGGVALNHKAPWSWFSRLFRSFSGAAFGLVESWLSTLAGGVGRGYFAW